MKTSVKILILFGVLIIAGCNTSSVIRLNQNGNSIPTLDTTTRDNNNNITGTTSVPIIPPLTS